MNFKNLDIDIQDPDLIGEILRAYCFIPDNYGGTYGCYSTFELRPEFRQIKGVGAIRFVNKILSSDSWWGGHYNNPVDQEDIDIQKEVYNKFLENVYTDGRIILAWHWDGDGFLAFQIDNEIYINDDCKKSYGWEKINEPK